MSLDPQKLAHAMKRDEGLVDLTKRIEVRIKLPIQRVLDHVPGKTVTEKCFVLGITRQCWYDWKRGKYRPTDGLAKTLSQMSGYPVEDIVGRSPSKRKKEEEMPDLELAHQAAESLEALRISSDIRHIANGLEVKQPNIETTIMRIQTLRSKLTRAMQLALTMETLLKKK